MTSTSTSSGRRQRAGRPKLDRAVVVDTAMALAEAEGLEAVTIRRLAQELSVTPMALYWHFTDKDALLAAISDRLWDETAGEIERAAEPPDGWAEMRTIVDALVGVLRRHPSVAHLAPHRVMAAESGIAVTERTLAVLAGCGFDLRLAAETAHIVLVDCVALVSSEPGGDTDESAEGCDQLRRKRLALASLPPERYPYVTACADYLTRCDEGSYFRSGVDLLLAGVRALAPERATPAAKRRATRGAPALAGGDRRRR